MSQTTALLKMLRKAGKHGVKNYEFPMRGILRYSARIGELRAEGFNIVAERQHLPNGRSTGVFTYVLIEEEKKKQWWKK